MDHPALKSPGSNRRTFLSLGSNIGDRHANIAHAGKLLESHPSIEILRRSALLDNPPILHFEQSDFLNQIYEARITLDPFDLLNLLQEIEKKVGRKKRFRYGPREIDLDILAMQDISLGDSRLTLPHPGLRNRDYLHFLLSAMGESPESLNVLSGIHLKIDV